MAAEAKQVDPTEYRVPRNFKLLDELESAEKGKYSDAKKYGEDAIYITVGLNGQDPTFTNWNGSIIPHQVEWTCFFLWFISRSQRRTPFQQHDQNYGL